MRIPTKIVLISILFIPSVYSHTPMYFCMAADTEFYKQLTNLIGSVHKYNFANIQAIAVFDLGFTPEQRTALNSMAKVQVYDVELTNPDLLTPFIVRPPERKDKKARGWYAWKPVVIKQALDMFPYVLYIDAGITVEANLKPLFKHIKKHDYALVTCGHSMHSRTTTFVKEQFNLDAPERQFILNTSTHGITAGIQGLTRAMYSTYVLPMYNHTKDMRYFADDGSTLGGFGTSRHDQVLFSIYARLLKLKIQPMWEKFGKDASFHDLVSFKEVYTDSKHIQYK